MARILLVDDEPELLEAMHTALTNADHEVAAVGNGSEVLDGTTGTDFDLAITDIIMPDVEGLETLSFLLKHNPRIKIIAITGGGRLGASFHLEMADKLGAIVTLTKPFALRTLVSTVEQVLGPDVNVGKCAGHAKVPPHADLGRSHKGQSNQDR